MKNKLHFLILLVCLPVLSAVAWESNLFFPGTLNSQNTNLTFELDSTWHAVHGKVDSLEGTITLADKNNPDSVTGKIIIPVKSMNTNNGMRDKKMRKVMDEKKYPKIIFAIERLKPGCRLNVLSVGHTCATVLLGKLTIRNITKDIEVPLSITNSNNVYDISGQTIVNWEEYGVEDPSILIAKVAKEVSIKFDYKLSSAQILTLNKK